MEENKKFKVNSEDTLLESRDIHTYFETNSQEEAMGYFLYKDFVEENKAFENKTNNGKRYFVTDENGELNIDFSQISSKEKERLINLYKENNAEHYKNEERLEKIKEQTSIEMGDPFGEYRNEIKGNEMKENEKNEELAIWSVDHTTVGLELPDEGYFTTYFSSKENANRFIVDNMFDPENGYKEYDEALFYDKDGNPEEPKKVTDDLIEMKKIARGENANGRNGEFFHFEQKVDEKLIDFICDENYSEYAGFVEDRKNFKENNVKYDENGFITQIKDINEEKWMNIQDFGDDTELLRYFRDSRDKNEKILGIYTVDHFIDGEDTLDGSPSRSYFTSKENAKNFITDKLLDPESDYNFFYNENGEVAINKDIDLFNMKAIAYYKGHLEEFKEFGKKIDEKLIEYISEKYEVDQKEFKENRVNYDDKGRIAQIQDENGKWVEIEEIHSFRALDQKIFNPNENEVEKRNEIEKNEEKLSLYVVSDNDFGIGELALSKDQAYNIAEGMDSDDVHISEEMTDLIKIKKAISWNVEANYGDYPNESIKAFEQKVDEKLVEHICEKNELDQEAFKENNVQYNHDGVITKIQAADNENWIDINHYLVKDINHFDEAFKNNGEIVVNHGRNDIEKVKVDNEPDINPKIKTKSHPKSKSKKDTGRDI